MNKLVGLIVCLTSTACAVEAVEEDGRDDSFLDGKADSANLVEGSLEAIGVLRVANGRTVAELVAHGIAQRAADNIVAGRVGIDDQLGTHDDIEYKTLAQLDAIPYVGRVTFVRLLEYAMELGYIPNATSSSWTPVDLWNVDESCAPIQWLQLIPKFAPGELQYVFPNTFTMAARHRSSCNTITGCGPWQPNGVNVWWNPPPADSWELLPGGPRRDIRMHLSTRPEKISFAFDGLNGNDLNYWCEEVEQFDNRPVMRCTTGEVFFESDMLGDARIVLEGVICATGTFHFRTKLGTETGGTVMYTTSRNQVAIYGKLW